MPELSRERDQIWITRSHLLALGVATLCIALLAFFLGLKLGRAGSGPEAAAAPPPLTADADRQAELEAVLRQAARAKPAEDFSFPKDLPADGVTAPGPEQASPEDASTTTVAPPVGQAIQSADAPVGKIPNGGWSVQIGVYATPTAADARMAELEQASLQPYRVAALVDGTNSWRVRLGGYKDRAEAEAALPELQKQLGLSDLSVAPAP